MAVAAKQIPVTSPSLRPPIQPKMPNLSARIKRPNEVINIKSRETIIEETAPFLALGSLTTEGLNARHFLPNKAVYQIAPRKK